MLCFCSNREKLQGKKLCTDQYCHFKAFCFHVSSTRLTGRKHMKHIYLITFHFLKIYAYQFVFLVGAMNTS